MKRRWICYECALTCAHTRKHRLDGVVVIDGWQSRYVKLPSTRPRKCSDCGKSKRHGFREAR